MAAHRVNPKVSRPLSASEYALTLFLSKVRARCGSLHVLFTGAVRCLPPPNPCAAGMKTKRDGCGGGFVGPLGVLRDDVVLFVRV